MSDLYVKEDYVEAEYVDGQTLDEPGSSILPPNLSKRYGKISQYVPNQFPSVYREDGPNLVAFVKTFYEWIETQGPIYASRNLLSIRDIDDTAEAYLPHFVYKYMNQMPIENLGNVRFLQKHILDLYRSKGSVEGLKILFRLMFNEEIDYYSPSKDMLSPSSAEWIEPRYLEVSYSKFNRDYLGKRIVGTTSGSTAIVEDYVETLRAGIPARIMYLSNIEGDFKVAENIVYTGGPIVGAPSIIGSVTSVELLEGIDMSSLDDRYVDERGARVRISKTRTIQSGKIEFILIAGGSGYSMSSTIEVVAGDLISEAGDQLLTEDGSYIDILPGSGASFKIAELTDVESIEIDTTILAPYINDTFEDATFLYDRSLMTQSGFTIVDFDDIPLLSSEPGATLNKDVIISDWATSDSLTAGKVARIQATSPGQDYIVAPTVFFYDEFVAGLGIIESGNIKGNNAEVMARLAEGIATSVSIAVVDSGYGYVDGEELTFKWAEDEYLIIEDGTILTTETSETLYYGSLPDDRTITGIVTLGPIGKGTGYWNGEDSMLNSSKKIQDSFYYQEYSYEVLSEQSLENYADVLGKTFHPAGSEMFGSTILKQSGDPTAAADATLEVLVLG